MGSLRDCPRTRRQKRLYRHHGGEHPRRVSLRHSCPVARLIRRSARTALSGRDGRETDINEATLNRRASSRSESGGAARMQSPQTRVRRRWPALSAVSMAERKRHSRRAKSPSIAQGTNESLSTRAADAAIAMAVFALSITILIGMSQTLRAGESVAS